MRVCGAQLFARSTYTLAHISARFPLRTRLRDSASAHALLVTLTPPHILPCCDISFAEADAATLPCTFTLRARALPRTFLHATTATPRCARGGYLPLRSPRLPRLRARHTYAFFTARVMRSRLLLYGRCLSAHMRDTVRCAFLPCARALRARAAFGIRAQLPAFARSCACVAATRLRCGLWMLFLRLVSALDVVTTLHNIIFRTRVRAPPRCVRAYAWFATRFCIFLPRLLVARHIIKSSRARRAAVYIFRSFCGSARALWFFIARVCRAPLRRIACVAVYARFSRFRIKSILSRTRRFARAARLPRIYYRHLPPVGILPAHTLRLTTPPTFYHRTPLYRLLRAGCSAFTTAFSTPQSTCTTTTTTHHLQLPYHTSRIFLLPDSTLAPYYASSFYLRYIAPYRFAARAGTRWQHHVCAATAGAAHTVLPGTSAVYTRAPSTYQFLTAARRAAAHTQDHFHMPSFLRYGFHLAA